MQSAKAITPKAIAARLRQMGISGPYASQIANGRRDPSPELAIRIAKETGIRLGLVEGATDEEVAVVSRLVERKRC